MPITTTSTYQYDSRTNTYRPLGLVSDSSTDNRSILQATLDAAAATSGIVYIPTGNFRVRLNSSRATIDTGGDVEELEYGLSVATNVHLIGQRNAKLILNETVGSHHQAVIYTSGNNSVIQGIQFDGSVSSTGASTTQHGVFVFGSDDNTVRDCRFSNFGGVGVYAYGDNGAASTRVNRLRVERNSFRTSRGVGVQVTYCQQAFLNDNHFETGQSTSVNSPAFALKQCDSVIISRAILNAWGPICSLDGGSDQRSITIGDIVCKAPATLATYSGVYTTHATPAIYGLTIGRILWDGSAASSGTNTIVYLRGVTSGSISQINIYGGGGALTTYDVRGANISVSSCMDVLGAATSTTATFGGGSSSKVQVGGCNFGGSATFTTGCTAIAGNSFVSGVALTSLTYFNFTGNSVAPATGEGVTTTSCTDGLIGGNDIVTNRSTGNCNSITSCTRVHFAGNRGHNIGTNTEILSDGGSNTNCAVHTSFFSSTGGVATHDAFASDVNNYQV